MRPVTSSGSPSHNQHLDSRRVTELPRLQLASAPVKGGPRRENAVETARATPAPMEPAQRTPAEAASTEPHGAAADFAAPSSDLPKIPDLDAREAATISNSSDGRAGGNAIDMARPYRSRTCWTAGPRARTRPRAAISRWCPGDGAASSSLARLNRIAAITSAWQAGSA